MPPVCQLVGWSLYPSTSLGRISSLDYTGIEYQSVSDTAVSIIEVYPLSEVP